MNELALFAGAGGGILGTLLLGWRVVCAVEINPYCREVLLRRQEECILPSFPIWDDIRTFDGKPWYGKVGVITAGFPCQPWSVAGQQQGELDERNLWPDTVRIIGEVRPRYCLLENVPGLLAHEYFGTILRDLAESGYDARWKVISAAELGAPHKRDRVWIVAHSNHLRQLQSQGCKQNKRRWIGNGGQDVADTECKGLARREGKRYDDGAQPKAAERGGAMANPTEQSDRTKVLSKETSQQETDRPSGGLARPSWWAVEPDVGRVADGVAHRVDRLKALGEGQVPGVVRAAWELLIGT